jgi:hypothetical protein
MKLPALKKIFSFTLFLAPVAANAAQEIVLDSVPPVTDETIFGGGLVEGRYLGNPVGVKLCAAVFIDGLGYFVKPSFAGANISIDDTDGSFGFDSTTGGCDYRWERLALTVIPDTESCPLPNPSPDPGSFALIEAQRIFDRQPRGVDFDSESLWVRDSGSCNTVGPGSNDFLRDNVHAQYDGLQLETSDDGSMLTSAEVVNRKPSGYGRYVHEFTLPPGGLDPGTVLGIFTFDRDGTGTRFNELDFEIGDSLIGGVGGDNAQCIVQGGDRFSFPLDPQEFDWTVVLTWSPGVFTCDVYAGHVSDDLGSATPFQTWTTSNNVPVPGADSRMRSNLWIHDPNIAAATSVRFKSIRWEPLPACGIDLVENSDGTRDVTIEIGNQDSSRYTLALSVSTASVKLIDVELPPLIPPVPVVFPLFELPDSFGVISFESTLVSSHGITCREVLRYDVAADRVLP